MKGKDKETQELLKKYGNAEVVGVVVKNKNNQTSEIAIVKPRRKESCFYPPHIIVWGLKSPKNVKVTFTGGTKPFSLPCRKMGVYNPLN
jgi:hypothetical protein